MLDSVMDIMSVPYSLWVYVVRYCASASFTLHFGFTSLAAIILGTGFIAYSAIRTRYFKNYSKLPIEPQRKHETTFHPELFVNRAGSDSKPGLHNYLDEFLSAIKVFGYLEKPVFHELTRHMQTRKLLAGETLNLEDEKSFCLVVDGHVQVFFKSDRVSKAEDDYEEGGEHYRLLTDSTLVCLSACVVANVYSAPLSSMFTILSLFTEDVKLRHGGSAEDNTRQREDAQSRPPNLQSPSNGHTPPGHLDHYQQATSAAVRGGKSSELPLQDIPFIPLLNPPIETQEDLPDSSSVHPGIIARANIDTTIAVIPAQAFRRLTRIYPRASAHIVQVIMTRFQRYNLCYFCHRDALTCDRVTFATGHNYLGLTAEILRTEKQMNDLTTYDLPNYVQASSLERLKNKIQAAGQHLSDVERANGLVVSSPAKRRPTSIRLASLRKRATTSGRGPASRDNLSPRMTSDEEVAKYSSDEADEDSAFRDSVLHCMFNSLGLEESTETIRSVENSVENSPRLASLDSLRHNKSSFGNVLSSMAMYDHRTIGSDGDSESAFTSNSLEGIEHEMDNDLEIIHFPKDSILVEAQERNPGLYYVIDGFLDVGIMTPISESARTGRPLRKKSGRESEATNPFEEEFEEMDDGFKSLYLVKPGGIAGYQAGIGNYRSFVDVRAKSDVLVGFLPRSSLERIMEKKPVVLLTMAKRLISLLSPLILHLDFALEWLQVSGGQTIYQQGDESDAIYIVLNGRVRTLRSDGSNSSQSTVTGEYGNGKSVGELEVLTDVLRPSTLHAVRETELARFPKQLFHSLALEHPGYRYTTITIQISRLIAKRMADLLRDRENGINTTDRINSAANLRTICILPLTPDIPVVEFADRLSRALKAVGSRVNVLNQATILDHLGRYAFSRMGKLRLASHLADQEEKFSKVLYVADAPSSSPWTQTCVSQADCVLLVCFAGANTTLTEPERVLLGTKTTARKELILLHPEKFVVPGSTRLWLRDRPWLAAHHHLVMENIGVDSDGFRPRTAQRTITTIKNKIENVQNSISRYTNRHEHNANVFHSSQQKNDYARLARRLCGRTIGLVLGGGGARGISHVGVIKALEEQGIPIDMVGGTSIGSFIGGLYARDGELLPMYGRAKKFSSRMAGLWRFALDLTYPTISYTTGHEFNRGIWKAFGQAQIEDFWLPFFCNTTNSKSCYTDAAPTNLYEVSQSRMDIHTTGYAWRYVRASMSLAGLVPPMTDEGDMLCDGGYVDNLPVSTMRNQGASNIFAVDVGSVDDRVEMHYGRKLSFNQ
ncbi:Lysophospholipase nte1 [Taphrina deformans PYCC 5710]|uniref:Lysophospholipase NTE1 n=1 Tax=Taphrina deformans (strain PYCC 5710 / ATCC 11124 / CBS 356.35 / IMI 108563 / JCM 9778 / NBRC 8474) TaxID=1097556 RepID=R4X6F1_TAPDE|nr:Lysophospholipase nte1 [Taphrina deformans PYCC 5710]|eukprot:CCG80664.1 Lysophospholipase nte1 [Taphrina deformans PYCC 5710]